MSVPRYVFSPDQLPMRGLTYPTPSRPVRYKDQWTGRPIDDYMTPRGLENQSVNCYRNSAWQAMMSIPAFCTWLQRNHGRTRSGQRSKCSAKECSGCQMYKVFDEIYPDNSREAHSPDVQLQILEGVDNYFSETDLGTEQKWDKTWMPDGSIKGIRNGQEDTAEYLSFMQEAVGKKVMDRAKFEFKNMFQLKSKVRCECRLVLNQYNMYPPSVIEEFIVPVDLPNGGKPWTVETHFAEMYSKCPFCGRPSGNGIERYRISDAPKALFVQINSSGPYSKRTEDIEFPDNLELTPYFAPELSQEEGPRDRTALYRLSSIIWHTGSGNTGHVTALIRDPTARWTYLDDNRADTYDRIEDFLVTRMGRTLGARWNAGILTYVKALDTSRQPTVESDEDEEAKGPNSVPPFTMERESKEQMELRRRELRRLQEQARQREEFFREEERRTEEARSWHERQEQLKRNKQREGEQAQGDKWRENFLVDQQARWNEERKQQEQREKFWQSGVTDRREREELNPFNRTYDQFFNPRMPQYSQDDSYKFRRFSQGQGLFTTSATNVMESPRKIAEFDRETKRLADEAAARGEPVDTTRAKTQAWAEDRHWQNVRMESLRRRMEQRRAEQVRQRREQRDAAREGASSQGGAEPSSNPEGKPPTAGAGHKPHFEPGALFRESRFHPYPRVIRKPANTRRQPKWRDVMKKSRFLGSTDRA